MPKFRAGKPKTGGRISQTPNKHRSGLEKIKQVIEKESYQKIISDLNRPDQARILNEIVSGFFDMITNKTSNLNQNAQ